MQDFREIKVWQKSHQLTLQIYKITKEFPKSELYGLVSQMRRAATSVPTNIAEGCVQRTDAQYARYLRISLGSANELDYQLFLVQDLHYITHEQYVSLHAEVDQIKKMPTSFIKQLKN